MALVAAASSSSQGWWWHAQPQASYSALVWLVFGALPGLLLASLTWIWGSLQAVSQPLHMQDSHPRGGAVNPGDAALEQQRTQLQSQLASLHQQQEGFMYAVSHELRTPLHAILGLADSLLLGHFGSLPADRTAAKVVTAMRGAGARLLAAVNDVLDAAAAGAGRLDVARRRVVLAGVVERAAQLSRPLAQPGVTLVLELPRELPAVRGDAQRLMQVLYNLLSNALKFTNTGRVTVRAVVEYAVVVSHAQAQGACHQPPGKQVEADKSTCSSSSTTSGSGCDAAAGGAAASGQQEHQQPSQSGCTSGCGGQQQQQHHEPRQVVQVCVEDTGVGIPPEKLSSIWDAFEQADAGSRRRYGGLGLGLSLVRSLVELQGGSIHAESKVGKGSVFTLTLPVWSAADGDEEESAASSTGGCSGRGSCRSSFDTSRATAVRCGAPAPAAAGGSCGGSDDGGDDGGSCVLPAPSKPCHREVNGGRVQVLCVDDDPLSHLILKRLLAPAGYIVARANSGQEALDFVEAADALPDLVLLDCMMPGLSGYDVAQELRCRFPATALPLVMVSANNAPDHVRQGLEAGCSDYVCKPFNHAELLARIAAQLRMRDLLRAELGQRLSHLVEAGMVMAAPSGSAPVAGVAAGTEAAPPAASAAAAGTAAPGTAGDVAGVGTAGAAAALRDVGAGCGGGANSSTPACAVGSSGLASAAGNMPSAAAAQVQGPPPARAVDSFSAPGVPGTGGVAAAAAGAAAGGRGGSCGAGPAPSNGSWGAGGGAFPHSTTTYGSAPGTWFNDGTHRSSMDSSASVAWSAAQGAPLTETVHLQIHYLTQRLQQLEGQIAAHDANTASMLLMEAALARREAEALAAQQRSDAALTAREVHLARLEMELAQQQAHVAQAALELGQWTPGTRSAQHPHDMAAVLQQQQQQQHDMASVLQQQQHDVPTALQQQQQQARPAAGVSWQLSDGGDDAGADDATDGTADSCAQGVGEGREGQLCGAGAGGLRGDGGSGHLQLPLAGAGGLGGGGAPSVAMSRNSSLGRVLRLRTIEDGEQLRPAFDDETLSQASVAVGMGLPDRGPGRDAWEVLGACQDLLPALQLRLQGEGGGSVHGSTRGGVQGSVHGSMQGDAWRLPTSPPIFQGGIAPDAAAAGADADSTSAPLLSPLSPPASLLSPAMSGELPARPPPSVAASSRRSLDTVLGAQSSDAGRGRPAGFAARPRLSSPGLPTGLYAPMLSSATSACGAAQYPPAPRSVFGGGGGYAGLGARRAMPVLRGGCSSDYGRAVPAGLSLDFMAAHQGLGQRMSAHQGLGQRMAAHGGRMGDAGAFAGAVPQQLFLAGSPASGGGTPGGGAEALGFSGLHGGAHPPRQHAPPAGGELPPAGAGAEAGAARGSGGLWAMLHQLGLECYAPLLEAQAVNTSVLALLSDQELAELGVVKIGDRARLRSAARGLLAAGAM